MRRSPTASEVHQAYMPHVPFKFYTNMVLGKDAPESPAEDFRVAERIRREADLYLQSQEERAAASREDLTSEERAAEPGHRLPSIAHRSVHRPVRSQDQRGRGEEGSRDPH